MLHQMSPMFSTCLATCVAMVAGQPAGEVWYADIRLFTIKLIGLMMHWTITKYRIFTEVKENAACCMGLSTSPLCCF